MEIQEVKKMLFLTIVLAFLLDSCGDNNHHYSDPCAGGPVSCLKEVEAGLLYCVFESSGGISSDGSYATTKFEVLWEETPDFWVTIQAKGPVIDCYTVWFEEARVDLDRDGILDYEGPAEGIVEVCKDRLTISDIVVDNYAYPDVNVVCEMCQIVPAPVPPAPPPPPPEPI